MILRVLRPTWRKLAEFLIQAKSPFSAASRYANVSCAALGTSTGLLSRIPSLFRGLAPIGAAPVLLPARARAQRMTHPFPKNLPLSVKVAGTRPRRTDHV